MTRPPHWRRWRTRKDSPDVATDGRSGPENGAGGHNRGIAPTIELLWPDGKVTTGASWREVEDAIRAQQWHTFRTRAAFRREMRRRAAIWAGHEVPPIGREASSRQFIRQLADAEMFQLVTN